MWEKIWRKFMNSGALDLPSTSTTKLANDILNTDTLVYPGLETMVRALRSEGQPSLPEDDSERSEFALADGLLDYFPNALAEVARISKRAGDKHHPGEAMHWERGKSTDHRNKIMRHLIDSGKQDSQGNRHSGALAWRALALLQEELEAEFGYPKPRNAV